MAHARLKKGTFDIALPCIYVQLLLNQHIVPRAHHRVIMDAHHLGPMPQQRYCTVYNNLQVYKHTWGSFQG